jgi:thiol peroxidase
MKRNDLVTFAGNPVTLVGEEARVGEQGKDFNAIKQDLSPFNFFSETEGKIVIISAVPSLDTGVCETQTIRFNKEVTNLSDDVFIVTISVDLPFAQSRFCEAKDIKNIVVVSDHKDLEFGNKYGFVLEEFRLLTRGLIVMDKDRTIKHVEYVPEVTNHPNYEAALEIIKGL